MSYILDALKKIENEKTKKSRSSGMVSISGELFRDEQRTDPRGAGWKIASVMAAVSLLTFGGTWFFFRSDKDPKTVRTTINLPAPTKTVSQPVFPQTAGPAAASQPATVAPALAQTSTQPALTKAAPVGRPIEPPVVAPKLTKQARQIKGQNLSVKTVVLKEPTVNQTIAAPADIQVSGIAWQDERSARRSVVNGFLLQEGSVVAGAKITEIHPDRVRFIQAGKSFEITLLASGVSGAK
ncbi:MAG TPA: hypothetical protein VGJ93_03810 [Desulfuromonadaceae bacterium]|jgi:general secretion pathway protein B